MAKVLNIAGVYSSEVPDESTPSAVVIDEKVGFSGAFEKGFIGRPIDVSNSNFTSVFGDGDKSNVIQDWHVVDYMSQDSIVSVSRAFNDGTTKTALKNITNSLPSFVFELIVSNTVLSNMLSTTTYAIDGNAVTLVKVEEYDVDSVKVFVKNLTDITITDGVSNLEVTNGGMIPYVVESHVTNNPLNTSKFKFYGASLSVDSDDKLYIDEDGDSRAIITGDVDASLFTGVGGDAIGIVLNGTDFDGDIDLSTVTDTASLISAINTTVGVDIASVDSNNFLVLSSDKISTVSGIEIEAPSAGTDVVSDFFSAPASAVGVDITTKISCNYISHTIDNGVVTLYVESETGKPVISVNSSIIARYDSGDVFEQFDTVFYYQDIVNATISRPITYQSVNNVYGTAEQIYDAFDSTFETNLKSNINLQDIIIFAKTPGIWGNTTTVQIHGKDAIEGSITLKKLVNFRTFADHELLILVANGSVSEKFIVTVNTDVTARDDNGNRYYIEDKLIAQSKLISIFVNLPDEVVNHLDIDVTLENGADGTIVANDVLTAYKQFGLEEYTCPLVLTGNGTYSAADLAIINEGVNTSVIDSQLDTFGKFNLPYSLQLNADIIGAFETWFDAGGWGISSTRHAYETLPTFFNISNKYGDKDIRIPSNVVMIKNDIQAMDVYGRQKGVFGKNRGVASRYKSVEWVPGKDDANELYLRRVNPLIFKKNTGIVKVGNKTGLNTESSLNRVNVRFKHNECMYYIDEMVDSFVAEDNDAPTRDKLQRIVSKYLQNELDNRGIDAFIVVCDLTNNTEGATDLYLDYGIDHKTAIERIFARAKNKSLL